MHILVQHEIEDFEVWKKVYDEDEPARAAAGFKEITLYQGLDNPNNVVAIFLMMMLKRPESFSNLITLRRRCRVRVL